MGEVLFTELQEAYDAATRLVHFYPVKLVVGQALLDQWQSMFPGVVWTSFLDAEIVFDPKEKRFRFETLKHWGVTNE